jgi:hypothetical protein
VLFLAVPLAQCAPIEQRDDGSPMTAEESARRQAESYWNLDSSTPGLRDMVVEIAVELNPDGSVQSARIDESGDIGNPNWRIFAESCRRALLKSSPLRMPPTVPYEKWKRLTLVFNAKEMLGQ